MDEKIDAGHIAAGPRKACDQTELDRVVAYAEDNWDCRGRGFGRESARGEARRGDHRHAPANQVCHSAGTRSYWPSIQWYSTATLRPSMKPVSLRPLRNAAALLAEASGRCR